MTAMKKATIADVTDGAALACLAEAGFDGVEAWNAELSPAEGERARRAAEGVGLEIHSLLLGGANFGDEAVADAEADKVRVALATAAAMGAGVLLLVPGRVADVPMPEPRQFDIEFDAATGRLVQVVAGDNGPYASYIEAHDRAAAEARRGIEGLIPFAERAGVVIAVENVWNNLWVEAEFFAHFIRSFGSPWVRAYFDVANHLKYGPAERWIDALGDVLARVHAKDFQLGEAGQEGSFVPLREGSVDWPSIRGRLGAVGYDGWLTLEGPGGGDASEQSRRMDLIAAGH